jgi:magnesium transporter
MLELEPNREVLADAVERLIEERDWRSVRRLLEGRDGIDVAELLEEMPQTSAFVAFRLLPRALATEAFSYLPSDRQNELVQGLRDRITRRLLADMDPDDRTRLFEELPGEATQKLLNLLSAEDLAEARLLLGYPEQSVGRLMNPHYVAVRPQWTIRRALEHMRERAARRESVDVIYVVDAGWKLVDALDLNSFVLANPDDRVESIMDRSFVALSAFDDRERAVQTMQRYDLIAVPVVDSDGVLLGAGRGGDRGLPQGRRCCPAKGQLQPDRRVFVVQVASGLAGGARADQPWFLRRDRCVRGNVARRHRAGVLHPAAHR